MCNTLKTDRRRRWRRRGEQRRGAVAVEFAVITRALTAADADEAEGLLFADDPPLSLDEPKVTEVFPISFTVSSTIATSP